MVVFDNNQFEIAVATYKRPEFVERWMEKCYWEAVKRNIEISIYDSSPDDKTKIVVDSFNQNKEKKVNYYSVDPSTIIGYKPMVPILNTKSEYLWIAGDSRYHCFNELDEKVFPFIKERKVDYIVINAGNNYKLDDEIYEDKGKMLHDTFVASTCIGLSMYRISLFDRLKTDSRFMRKCDELFKNNYGFGWLGYFYNVYALGNYKTLLTNVEILPVLNKKKTQSWTVRFYGCWVDDLCQMIDNIPDIFCDKDSIPKNTWAVMKLDSVHYVYLAKKHGDLNKTKYEQMVYSGSIIRITDNPRRIKIFATMPMWIIEVYYFSYRVKNSLTKQISQVLGGKGK